MFREERAPGGAVVKLVGGISITLQVQASCGFIDMNEEPEFLFRAPHPQSTQTQKGRISIIGGGEGLKDGHILEAEILH